MTSFWKLVSSVSLVIAVIAVGLAIKSMISTPVGVQVGAVGSKYIEQYNPYVKLNGGINTQLPVKTSGQLSASSTVVTGAPFCIEFYATSTNTVLHLVASTTGSIPNGSAAAMTANYGTCQ